MVSCLLVAVVAIVGGSEVVVALAKTPTFEVRLPVPTVSPLLGAREAPSRLANHLVVDQEGRALELHTDGLRVLETGFLGCFDQIPLWRERVQLYVDPRADSTAIWPMLAYVPPWPGDAHLVIEAFAPTSVRGRVQRIVPIRTVGPEEQRSECFVDLRGHRTFDEALDEVSHTCVELLFPDRGDGWDEFVGFAEPWLLGRDVVTSERSEPVAR